MRLTPENKEKVRQRILAGAATLFRERGYDGVNLDQLMTAAGLTRGAFYAHFRSKQALFAEVIRHQHPLLAMLEARAGRDAATLWRELREILDAYLDPTNLAEVYRGCTVASLTGDAARAAPEVRQAYGAAWAEIVAEMARGQAGPAPAPLRAALTLASGAVNTAASCAEPQMQAEVLSAARAAVAALLAEARAGAA
ncbi:MAG: TetR family transcriptional regulator [Pseudomonadota bacterium]